MNLEGKLHLKFDTVQKSEKFASRKFILESASNPMYPQFLEIELSQDKCALLDPIKVGDKIEVAINLKGREWTSPQGEVKWFNSIEAWKIQKLEQKAESVEDIANRSS